MKIENIEVFNFEGAFRGLRNPKESWEKSDSYFGVLQDPNEGEHIFDVLDEWIKAIGETDLDEDSAREHYYEWLTEQGVIQIGEYGNACNVAYLGPKDMALAERLIKGGSEHRKFLRQIVVSMDITAPLLWFKEFDTYKVGTVANSTSTMHKITSKPITIDCFEIDDFENITYPESAQREDLKHPIDEDFVQMCLIPYLEYLRVKYLETNDKKYWKELIRWLPESWLQTRTVTMNYENLLSMCSQRENHKLAEWNTFIEEVKNLPYANELIFCN